MCISSMSATARTKCSHEARPPMTGPAGRSGTGHRRRCAPVPLARAAGVGRGRRPRASAGRSPPSVVGKVPGRDRQLYTLYTTRHDTECDDIMSIRHALLALLSEGPKYGLQLREEFEARTGEVWPLNVGQVYTTLQRLERDGLAESDDA